MEQFPISEEKLKYISEGMIGSLRKDHIFQHAGILISEMSSSIVPVVGVSPSSLGYENVQEAFQALKDVQEKFSNIFHEVLKDSIEFTESNGTLLRWDYFESRVVPSEIDGQRIKIRLVLRWDTPNRVLSTGRDCARWKETK